MAWSSSSVSWRMTRLGRMIGSILQEALPRFLMGGGPDLNGSGWLGGAGQEDIIGGGVLRWKRSNP